MSVNCVPKLVWDFPRLCGLDTLIKFIYLSIYIFFKLGRTYAALYCGPIVNQSFLDKIWLVSPAQCLSIVKRYVPTVFANNEFSAKIQMLAKRATILNDVTSTSSGMSQKQWVKCLCQVAEIVKVCPINFCRI